jgi:hypothetical protein
MSQISKKKRGFRGMAFFLEIKCFDVGEKDWLVLELAKFQCLHRS